jgi:hypothetical protein
VRTKRFSPGWPVLALAETALLLLLGELLVSATRVDVKLMAPLIRFQGVDVAGHRVSSRPGLHYELEPGTRSTYGDGRTVTVDSFGFRGPERAARKPAGVFRIIALGGSNTYGASVADGETYPALLEKELNRAGGRRYEVWNGGVCAYVLSQNVLVARRAAAELDPDLILFQVGNPGPRPFLYGSDWRPFLRADRELMLENLRFPEAPSAAHRRLFELSGLYRAAVILRNRANHDPAAQAAALDSHNHSALARFVEETRSSVPSAILVPPWTVLHPELAGPAPAIVLKDSLPRDADREYFEAHPPPRVYRWYAKALAAELRRRRLIPRR